MIAVGAAFKFYSGTDVKRAPHWMVKMHLEFVYRIFSEPKKQLKRCGWIVYTLPGLLYREWRKNKIKGGSSIRTAFIIHIPLILRGTAIPTNLHTLSSHRSMGTLYEHSRSTDNALQS